MLNEILNSWDYLYVKTYPECSSKLQMYLSGFLEGLLTKKQTYNFLDNSSVRKNRNYNRLANFFNNIDSSLEKRLNSQEFVGKLNETESKYWIQVKSNLIFFVLYGNGYLSHIYMYLNFLNY